MTVLSEFKRFFKMTFVFIESIAEVPSSTKIISLSYVFVRAKITFCLCPPDKLLVSKSILVSIPFGNFCKSLVSWNLLAQYSALSFNFGLNKVIFSFIVPGNRIGSCGK